MGKFEIELRGPLDSKKRNSLKSFLEKNGRLVRKYEREQWIFGFSHQKKIDLRIKRTNGEYEFSLKVGKLANANRKEISIPFPKEKFKESLEFIKFLGHREGLTATRNAYIFDYDGTEWAIVEVPGHSYYFEAEKLVSNKRKGAEAEHAIRETANRLGLKIFTEKETLSYIKQLDKEANKTFKLK